MEAASRVYQQLTGQADASALFKPETNTELKEKALRETCEIFFAFTSNFCPLCSKSASTEPPPHQLQIALQQLEDATKKLSEISPRSPTLPTKSDSCWMLVNQFCKLHGLPLCPTNLIEMARDNDWVMFLFEAQTQGFPPGQLLNIVNQNFQDQALKEHIAVVIRTMVRRQREKDQPQRKPIMTSSSDLSQLDALFLKKPVSKDNLGTVP